MASAEFDQNRDVNSKTAAVDLSREAQRNRPVTIDCPAAAFLFASKVDRWQCACPRPIATTSACNLHIPTRTFDTDFEVPNTGLRCGTASVPAGYDEKHGEDDDERFALHGVPPDSSTLMPRAWPSPDS
jgi:hypothetical protein